MFSELEIPNERLFIQPEAKLNNPPIERFPLKVDVAMVLVELRNSKLGAYVVWSGFVPFPMRRDPVGIVDSPVQPWGTLNAALAVSGKYAEISNILKRNIFLMV